MILQSQLILEKKLAKKYSKKSRNQRIAKIRRQRGYNWENTLVKRFNSLENWKAFRLGSPSVALPDVLVVNNIESTIFTIEAKSGTGTTLQVPFDQIERCMHWTNNFLVYKNREVILAFKFLSKKRIDTDKYEKRELHEFYKFWDKNKKAVNCVCTYAGDIYELDNGKRKKLHLKDALMPFKSKHQFFIK